MNYALLIYDTNEGWEKLSEEEKERTFGEYLAVREVPGAYGGRSSSPWRPRPRSALRTVTRS